MEPLPVNAKDTEDVTDAGAGAGVDANEGLNRRKVVLYPIFTFLHLRTLPYTTYRTFRMPVTDGFFARLDTPNLKSIAFQSLPAPIKIPESYLRRPILCTSCTVRIQVIPAFLLDLALGVDGSKPA
jgi:hypothetical protein